MTTKCCVLNPILFSLKFSPNLVFPAHLFWFPKLGAVSFAKLLTSQESFWLLLFLGNR